MSMMKIAITIEEDQVRQIDNLVKAKRFSNRSKIIQQAVQEKLTRINQSRLARECAKLDVAFERELAEEGFNADIESWPKY